MDGENEEVIEDFYGVYMLYCTNPKYLGRTYIGYTVNPNRRVNQHNKGTQFGGAKRTSNKGPWDMVLIIHGFPNDVAALRFEWAWQNPHRSRRLGNVAKTSKRTIDFCLRIVSRMLNVGPWNRLPLTVRWLKPDYQRDFPVSIPEHMSVVQGALVTKRLNTQSVPELDAEPPSSIRCGLCHKSAPPHLCLTCVSCDLQTHSTCLAGYFLRHSDSSHIIPVQGTCPSCKMKVMWGELIRKSKGCNVKI